MAFAKYSIDFREKQFTLVSNVFLHYFMPSSPEGAVKVYLQGLAFCDLESDVNTLDNFCESLNMTKQEVEEHLKYWQEQGVLQIVDMEKLDIVFLNLDNKVVKFKRIDEEKYGDFYIACQSLLNRALSPNEFKDFVEFIEKDKLEKEAMLMIIKYCVETKGDNVAPKYIISVAKNWIGEKILTVKKVEKKLEELALTSENIKNIFVVLGINRSATLEERDMYLKWTKSFFFTDSTIIEVAKFLKKKGGMKALDAKLTKYHSLQLLSIDEIENHENNKKHYLDLAREITSKLGLYFENLEPVIDNYINVWLYKGYSDETLKTIAKFCFKSENNSLEQMDIVIQKLYKQGIVSLDAIVEYIQQLNLVDEKIKDIFEKLSIKRIVTNRDREVYNIWTNDWLIGEELLEYAISISQGKTQPYQYLNKVLANFHEKDINSVEKAKEQNLNLSANNSNKELNMNTRSYTDEEVNRLFDNLKEIDI